MNRTRACTPGPMAKEVRQMAATVKDDLEKLAALVDSFHQQNDLDDDDLGRLEYVRELVGKAAKILKGVTPW